MFFIIAYNCWRSIRDGLRNYKKDVIRKRIPVNRVQPSDMYPLPWMTLVTVGKAQESWERRVSSYKIKFLTSSPLAPPFGFSVSGLVYEVNICTSVIKFDSVVRGDCRFRIRENLDSVAVATHVYRWSVRNVTASEKHDAEELRESLEPIRYFDCKF